jgi:ribonuclease P protein component
VSAYSFSKQLRLLNAGDYQPVFNDACWKVSTKEILLLCKPNGLEHPRLGLVVAKKHIRSAVQRNRFKRLVRESFRLHQQDISGIDIVVLARKDADLLANEDLTRQITGLWYRLNKRRQNDKSNSHLGLCANDKPK